MHHILWVFFHFCEDAPPLCVWTLTNKLFVLASGTDGVEQMMSVVESLTDADSCDDRGSDD